MGLGAGPGLAPAGLMPPTRRFVILWEDGRAISIDDGHWVLCKGSSMAPY